MKTHHIATILGVAFSFAIPSMATPEETPADQKPWREIAKGADSGIEEPSRLAIRDKKSWEAWWQKHTKNSFDPENPNKPPFIDFDKETVLVATMGMRTSGGFSIHFGEIRKTGDTLTVVVKATAPAPDDMVTMALTHPFGVVAIPRHEGTIEFLP